jgi:alpha-glucosidase (family GH31 glycosyl hydrolase)
VTLHSVRTLKVPALIKQLNTTNTKLILWEHPILDQTTEFYTSLQAAGCLAKAAGVGSTNARGVVSTANSSTVNTNGSKTRHAGVGSSIPDPTRFSDLTLTKCRTIWFDFQLNKVIKTGAVGFKLDEDDVDVYGGWVRTRLCTR